MRRTPTLFLLAGVLATTLVAPAWAVYETPTRVSGAPVATAHADPYAYSPDSEWVVFRSDRDVDGVYHLWSVPLDGTPNPTPTRIDAVPPGSSDRDVFDFVISPDSTRVVYTADIDTNGVEELFSVPIGGGTSVKVSGPNPANGSIEDFAVTADSARVVFLGDLGEAGTTRLYSRPLDGSGSRSTLSPSPDVDGGDVEEFQLTPDGQHVVLMGQLREHGPGQSYGDIVVSPADGSASAQYVTSTPAPGNEGAYSFVVTPDGSRVAYVSMRSASRAEVLSRPLDLSTAEVLISQAPSGESVHDDLHVSADSSRVVYIGDLDTTDEVSLYNAPVDGSSTQVQISDATDGDVINAAVSPDGTRVAYRAGPLHLFTAPIGGGESPVQVSAAIGAGEFGVISFKIAPDSSHVLFLQDVDGPHAYELFSRPLDGSGTTVQVNTEPPAPDGFVTRFEFAPDASRVVYMGELEIADRHDLYSRPLDGSGTQVKVNPDAVDGLATPIEVAPDSATVLFPDDTLAGNGVAFELHVSGVGQFAPGPVGSVNGENPDHESATVTWDPPFGNPQVTSYEVVIAPAPTSGPDTFTVAGDALELFVGNLAAETTYDATVTATNDAGDSPAAQGTFATTAAPDPDPDPDPEPEPGEPGVHRLAGTNRYDTAAQVALDRFEPADVDTVYLAVGGNFPDALAGGPLAAAQGAPILLATSTSLPEPTAAALTTLDPDTVVALGGQGVLPDGILEAAATAAGGAATDRIAGTNRYETAAAIAAELPPSDRAFLAVGTNFPDALAGGPATNGAPILLAAPTSLPTATASALDTLGPDTVIALGGEGAVPPAVLAAAAEAAGGAAENRVAGTNRYTTATAIADLLPTPPATIYVAVGGNFPDALAGSPAAAAEGAPIILIASSGIPDAVATWIDALPALTRIVILGGEGVVSSDVAAELATYLD